MHYVEDKGKLSGKFTNEKKTVLIFNKNTSIKMKATSIY